jgi:hypothetical protein
MPKKADVFFWKKLDYPGSDCCRLVKEKTGWRLSGAAVFFEGEPCQFQYEVSTDLAWRTRSVNVSGFKGKKPIELDIRSIGGSWIVNGVAKRNVVDCVDVDLGFTPATNLIVLRRLSLKVGQQAEAPAAYLSFPEMRMIILPQTYRRISPTEYQYDSPTHGYSEVLHVLHSGVVIKYPGLFELMNINPLN